MGSQDGSAILKPETNNLAKRIFVLAFERPLFVGMVRNFRDQGIDYKTSHSFTDILNIIKSKQPPEVLLIEIDSVVLKPAELSVLIDAARERTVPVILKGNRIFKTELELSAAGAALSLPSLTPFLDTVHALHSLAVSSKGRKDPRVKLNFPAKMAVDNETKIARIIDLSASGALVFGETLLQEGSQFNLTFALPRNKKEIIANCIVARITTQLTQGLSVGLGIKFTDFAGDSGRRIDRFVTRKLTLDAEQQFFSRDHIRTERK